MAAKYILATLACVFLLAALTRTRNPGQTRTWLLIAAIFGLISFWLFSRG
jgi:DMSO reductase anchor subunit